MIKPNLEIIEKDDNHIIYLLSTTYDENNLYEKAKAINKFLTSESKMLEKYLETDLRHFLLVCGIIPSNNTKWALQKAFDTLKRQKKRIVIIDRYKNVDEELIVGVSENEMTVICEKGGYISISVEIRLEDL